MTTSCFLRYQPIANVDIQMTSMNLVIKECSDDQFLDLINKSIVTSDDIVICGSATGNEVVDLFASGKVYKVTNNLVSSIWQASKSARTLGVCELLFAASVYPSIPHLFVLHALSLIMNARLCVWSNNEKIFPSFAKTVINLLILILSPLIALVLSPLFICREVVGHFILAQDTLLAPFIAVGKLERVSGVAYWYSFTNRAKKNGLFGYAFSEYLGVPVSLYNFPLSVYLLKKYRFRFVFIAGFCLLCAGFISLYYSAQLSPFLLVPVILISMASNTIWEHASLGVYEILAWGFGLLSIALSDHPLASGIFLGLTVISHLGVAMLIGILSLALSLSHDGITRLFLSSLVAFGLSGYWLIPYMLCWHDITRGKMINEEYDVKKEFGFERIIQLIIYSLTPLSLLLLTHNRVAVMVATLPLLISILNAKIIWVFSPYTVRMFQTVAGLIALAMVWNPYSFFFLVLFLYLPPSFLSWMPHDDQYYFSLRQSPRLDTISRCATFFSDLSADSRVGFECGSKRAGWKIADQYLAVLFCYYLSDKNVEVFNSGMTELVKYDLFKKTCRNFNSISSDVEFLSACHLSGLTHVVSFSENFRERLIGLGFNVVSSQQFDEQVKNISTRVNVSLHAVACPPDRSSPPAAVLVSGNSLKISFIQGGRHRLSYSHHRGLKAIQNDRELPLSSDEDGMLIIDGAQPGNAIVFFDHKRLFNISLLL